MDSVSTVSAPSSPAAASVDNSVASTAQTPTATPAQGPAPTAPTTPAGQPGTRSLEIRDALLNGADPTTLFGGPSQQAAGQQTASAAAMPTAQAQTPQPQNPAVPEPQATPAPAAAPEQPILGKFKTVEDLAKSYQEMERTLGAQGDKVGKLERQLRVLTTQPPPSAPQTPAQVSQPAQPDPFDFDSMAPETREKALEEYYADPIAYNRKMFEAELQKRESKLLESVRPVIEEHKQRQQVAQFDQQIKIYTENGQHSDFLDLAPKMQEILNQYQADYGQEYVDSFVAMPNAVDLLYNAAKGSVPPPAQPAPPPTLEQMLADPAMRQRLMSDPAIVAEIRKGYVQEVAAGVPPQVLGSQPGGLPPAMPAEKPRTIREASSFARRWLSG